jgi:hypothetical protein
LRSSYRPARASLLARLRFGAPPPHSQLPQAGVFHLRGRWFSTGDNNCSCRGCVFLYFEFRKKAGERGTCGGGPG